MKFNSKKKIKFKINFKPNIIYKTMPDTCVSESGFIVYKILKGWKNTAFW